ncbi:MULTISPECIES: primosomal replication protein PriC [Tenebrionibacter/Tenebrionicola group]|jgi:primosomal replication protein N''|uniref:Primosomal replication protein n=2 Tax=Tenebrionibacter/Tenebrionicola group TaxID=2969848 RepID=A0A8K0V7R5_9ENTR|nr:MULTISPECIES: primosomal replication protein PriC [Tenebrionibacter/Tenebrionicola group]MBK4715720.1 primosomal replication protein [Tenebrionibacter intestinalis]MBV5096300.1 primosomal replication protein [Tenebrionicola larvae]
MKTRQLIETLEARIAQLTALITPFGAHCAVSSRFNRQLFHGRSTRMGDCLHEVEANWRQLKTLIEQNRVQQAAWLADRLVAQITALTREAATGELRRYDAAQPSLARLNANLLRHQDYERRLLAMKNARITQLTAEQTLAGQQRLARELEALDGRLARCREALANITRAVERRTR